VAALQDLHLLHTETKQRGPFLLFEAQP
jgi:hypothetical protein